MIDDCSDDISCSITGISSLKRFVGQNMRLPDACPVDVFFFSSNTSYCAKFLKENENSY